VNRIERVREMVDDVLYGQPDAVERRCGFVHLYGVAQAAALLALQRELDPELATVAGMLHDIDTYRTAAGPDHAARSADQARQILREADAFAAEEIEAICAAIRHHSDKRVLHGPLDELLKDADVWQYYLYNVTLSPHEGHEQRRDALRREFSVDG
jgi:HD superfamily phosphodiesterase